MNRNILYILGALMLIIVFYLGRCSNDSEPSMRAYKKAQERKLDSIRGQGEIQEKIIRQKDIELVQSDNREKALERQIEGQQEIISQQRQRFTTDKERLLKSLQNASDKELADTLTGQYLKETNDRRFNLSGNVIISRQVAIFSSYKIVQAGHLLAVNSELDSLLTLWEIRAGEFQLQINLWKEKDQAKDRIIVQRDAEIVLFKDGQEFMEGKARKFRRQRNGVIVVGGLAIGGIVYFLVK